MERLTGPRRPTRAPQVLALAAFVLVGLVESGGLTAAVPLTVGDPTSAVVPAPRSGQHAVQVSRATTSQVGGIRRRVGGPSGQSLTLALVTLLTAIAVVTVIRGTSVVPTAAAGPGRVRRRGPPLLLHR